MRELDNRIRDLELQLLGVNHKILMLDSKRQMYDNEKLRIENKLKYLKSSRPEEGRS